MPGTNTRLANTYLFLPCWPKKGRQEKSGFFSTPSPKMVFQILSYFVLPKMCLVVFSKSQLARFLRLTFFFHNSYSVMIYMCFFSCYVYIILVFRSYTRLFILNLLELLNYSGHTQILSALLWCFSSFSSIKSLEQEMIICPNSSRRYFANSQVSKHPHYY